MLGDAPWEWSTGEAGQVGHRVEGARRRTAPRWVRSPPEVLSLSRCRVVQHMKAVPNESADRRRYEREGLVCSRSPFACNECRSTM
jgi:hypothetical protein